MIDSDETVRTSSNRAVSILDKALELAEAHTWESVHLHDIAETLSITLDLIYQYYPQKDDLVEAWFDRADKVLLKTVPSEEFLRLSGIERLHQVMMAWFRALSPHRRITRQMLLYKLEFGHIHLQVLGMMRVSRKVQWFREAAQLDTVNLRRVLEEITLTSIYLLTFSYWLFDDSHDSVNTDGFLKKHLDRAEKISRIFDFP